MKTMLVPVDFTPTSDNALQYAVQWAKEYGYEHIILLKTLYESLFGSMITAVDYVHVSGDYRLKEREEAKEQLEEMCQRIIKPAAPGMKVSLAVGDEPLLRSVLDIIESEQPVLVVLGSDNYSYSSESFISGHVISIARTSPVRVLIVPAHCAYEPVRQALVPCDFSAVEALSKVDSYQSATPQWREKKLLVLNVDPKEKYKQPDDDFYRSEEALHHYLRNFKHEVFYSNNRNIIDGITQFSNSNDVQIIIALPGKYSFLYSLTHKSISEAMYRNAKKPVLILK